MAKIGEVIDGKYEILKQIGKGGMSRVYLAMDRRLNKQWAVKEIRRSGTDPRLNEVVINSAIVEANIIKTLDHYHIPRINDILEYDEYIYVVMDYVEGEALSKILQIEGPQPEKQVIKWGMQLSDALQYMHTRQPPIIYRDMKPSNVMIKPDGDVKLIDFGIAREYKEKNIADTTVLGTVGYAPPEQFGGGQTDARADIYALGATLYHTVTGHGPVKGEAFIIRPIRDVNSGLSGGLEKIIHRCTMQDPDSRYQSCTELMYDLEHYREIDDAFIAGQKAKLKKFLVVAGLALVCLAVGFVGYGMRIYSENNDYNQNLAMAERSTGAEKVEYYRRMMEIKPMEETPYAGMVDEFKSDTDFSVDEEERLLDAITPYKTELREMSFYPGLAFEIGKLYWYYYSYGDDGDQEGDANQSTRMKSAVTWFDDVMKTGGEDAPNYKVAKIYHDIGSFKTEIDLNVAEASDSGMYKPFFENIGELLDLISGDENESEIVRLTVDAVAFDAIGTYSRELKADGVTQEEMSDVYDRASMDMGEIDAQNQDTDELVKKVVKQALTSVKDKADIANKAIETVFRVDGSVDESGGTP
jgi:serine/threonine-protein kinase